MINQKKFVVYEVSGTSYKYGICIAFGKSETEVIKDFLKSRKDSELKFKVLKVCKDRKEAIKVRGWLNKYE